MEKLQQFELKHRADVSTMKAQYESLATAGSTKSIMPQSAGDRSGGALDNMKSIFAQK